MHASKPLSLRMARLRALSTAQWRMLIACAVLVPIFWLGLRTLGLARFQSHLRSSPLASPVALSLSEMQALSEWVDVAARYSPFPSTCLSRSLLLRWLLHRRGVASELRIGARKMRGALEAHAWLEFEGVPVNDNEGIAAQYAPLVAPKP